MPKPSASSPPSGRDSTSRTRRRTRRGRAASASATRPRNRTSARPSARAVRAGRGRGPRPRSRAARPACRATASITTSKPLRGTSRDRPSTSGRSGSRPKRARAAAARSSVERAEPLAVDAGRDDDARPARRPRDARRLRAGYPPAATTAAAPRRTRRPEPRSPGTLAGTVISPPCATTTYGALRSRGPIEPERQHRVEEDHVGTHLARAARRRRASAPPSEAAPSAARARRGTPAAASHGRRAGVRGREHGRLPGREPPPQLVEVRLDAAVLGREVVGDQQARHRRGCYELASCSASSHDPRSAMMRRYCITCRGRLKPSAPTSRPRAAEQRDELALGERAVRDVQRRRRPTPRRPSGSCGRTGRTTRTAPARTARVVVAGEQPAGRVHALLGRVRPVLEPHQLAVEQRVRPAGDVAGGDDPRRGRARLVAHDAVVDREPRSFEPRGLGHDADADHDDVGRDRGAVAEPHAARPAPSPSIASTCTPVRRSTPWSRCISAITAPSSGPEPAHHRLRQRLEHRDVEAAAAARRRDLRADEAGADHDDLRAARRACARSASASSSVRSMNTPARSGWFGQPAGRRAGRDHEPVERDARAVGERRPRASPTSSATARVPSRQSSVEVVDALLAQHDLSGSQSPREQLLRERRAVVRAGAARRRSRRSGRRSPRAGASRRAQPGERVRRRDGRIGAIASDEIACVGQSRTASSTSAYQLGRLSCST